MKFLKTFLIIAGLCVAGLLGYAFFDRQFKLSNVKGEWPQAASMPVTGKQALYLKEVFSQPFHYLDRGKQSYVFVSQDQKYVLKLFDNRCLRSGPLPFLFSVKPDRCKKKLVRLFKGYQIAQSTLVDHTGLLFVQLAPDDSYDLYVNVSDRFGIVHRIKLAEVPFVLQLKAIPLRELMTSLLKEGKVGEAEQRLYQIAAMYIEGYKKGVVDMDHNFMYNTGFVGDNPLRIDLGRLKLDEQIKEPKFFKEDLHKVFVKRLGEWMERHFPQYRQKMVDDMQLWLERNT